MEYDWAYQITVIDPDLLRNKWSIALLWRQSFICISTNFIIWYQMVLIRMKCLCTFLICNVQLHFVVLHWCAIAMSAFICHSSTFRCIWSLTCLVITEFCEEWIRQWNAATNMCIASTDNTFSILSYSFHNCFGSNWKSHTICKEPCLINDLMC